MNENKMCLKEMGKIPALLDTFVKMFTTYSG